MAPSRVLIVGSGISGLYCALALAQKGHSVTVVEKSPSLGGLLGSHQNQDGDSFDYGTHFISATGDPTIDELLTPAVWRADWLSYDTDRAGHYFNGRLDERCTFVNTSTLPQTVQQQGDHDLLAAKGTYEEDYSNLERQLIGIFGEGYYQSVFGPSLKSKFPGADLKNFVPNCHTILGLKRLAISNEETTKRLKENPLYDGKIAFHVNQPGGANLYYPRQGGIGDWVNRLKIRAEKSGVIFQTSTNINSFKVAGKKILSADIEGGGSIACDHVISAIPAGLFVRLVNPAVLTGQSRPAMVPTFLVNLTFNEAPIPTSAYVFNHDPHWRPFRVTLYSNFQHSADNRHRMTVEVLGGQNPLPDMKRQLVAMGIVSPEAEVLAESCSELAGGFPYFTHELEKTNQHVLQWCEANLENVILVGRSGGRDWLMTDVLKAAKLSLGNLL